MPAAALTPQRGIIMKKKLLFTVMLVMILALGMSVLGCKDDAPGGFPNGTWYNYPASVTISGASFTVKVSGTAMYKGTITFHSSGNLLVKISQENLGGRWTTYNPPAIVRGYWNANFEETEITVWDIDDYDYSGFEGTWTKSGY